MSNGVSGHTDLVFTAGNESIEGNRNEIIEYVLNTSEGDVVLLNKVRGGDGHGGGAIFDSSSTEYQSLAAFLAEMTGNDNETLESNEIFSKLSLDNEQITLRRALLLFAARMPTDAELSLVEGDIDALKDLLKANMTGPGFHDFLIRGANDRLLTDSFINGQSLDILDPFTFRYPILADIHVQARNAGDAEVQTFYQWKRRLDFGVTRAPLELIAHIVENDLPYTEILTADYTMVNPFSAQIYNADVQFDDETDHLEFKPARNNGQILADQFYDGEFVLNIGTVVYSHGDFVEYPHAGILNEPAFLNRYPSTDTNRNRARSRWTNFHFLGVDIEKSAGRTNDPEALADTNNPTMNNPNCTVCHQIMDPVAGTFQNYGDQGYYRGSWGGLDSLPDTYKRGEDTPYVRGDTWYRDMRSPGFGNLVTTNNTSSLQWLAQQIVADERFARAAVQFWWPAVMSEPLREAPENSEDVDYQAQLLGYEAQQTLINELATNFAEGFSGGTPYNLKDLLIEMVLSPWFRGSGAVSQLSEAENTVLESVGKARLLTSEELEAKTRSLLGFAWGERFDSSWQLDGHWSFLQDSFRIYYGGIDSLGVTERANVLNSLMSNVALNQALSMGCEAVVMDFNREDSEKVLFKYTDRYTTPTLQDIRQAYVTGTDQDIELRLDLTAGEQALRLSFENPYWDSEVRQSLILAIHSINVRDQSGNNLLTLEAENILDTEGATASTDSDGNYTGGVYWNNGQRDGWQMWNGYIEVPINPAQNGEVIVEVNASRLNFNDRSALMSASVNLPLEQTSAGQQTIRQQIQYLHQRLLGEWLELDAPELDASYDLFVELWQERQQRGFPRNAIAWDNESCKISEPNWWDQDRSNELADPSHILGTWMSMLTYFLTDYHYLHE